MRARPVVVAVAPAVVVVACLLQPAPAAAQATQSVRSVEVSAELLASTDYRFRGYSRSDGKPTLQARLDATVETRNGFSLFAGIEPSIFPANRRYGGSEADFYAGLESEVGAVHVTGGVRTRLFLGRTSRNYVELFGSGRMSYGPLSGKLGFTVAPGTSDYGDRRGLYVFSDFDAGFPGTPITLAAHLGRETAANEPEKIDWSLSATYVLSPVDISVSYVDTNRFLTFDAAPRPRNRAGGALVVALRGSF